MKETKHKLTKKDGKKGGKKSAKVRKKKSEELKDASLKEIMIDVIKSPQKKIQICNAFLQGKFNAKSMQVLLQMLDGTEAKTSLEEFLNNEEN